MWYRTFSLKPLGIWKRKNPGGLFGNMMCRWEIWLSHWLGPRSELGSTSTYLYPFILKSYVHFSYDWIEPHERRKPHPALGLFGYPLAQVEFRISWSTMRFQIKANLTNYKERIHSYFVDASSIKLGKNLLQLPLPLCNKLMIGFYFLHRAEGLWFPPLGEECWEN